MNLKVCRRCATRPPKPGLRWCEPCVRAWFDQLMSEIADVPRPTAIEMQQRHAQWHRQNGIPCSGMPSDPYCVAAERWAGT